MEHFGNLKKDVFVKVESTEELFSRLSTPKLPVRIEQPSSSIRNIHDKTKEKKSRSRPNTVAPASNSFSDEWRTRKGKERVQSAFSPGRLFDSHSEEQLKGLSRLKRVELLYEAELLSKTFVAELTEHITRDCKVTMMEETPNEIVPVFLKEELLGSDEEGDDGPKSSFVTYLAEGDKLYIAGEYQKALESYRTALEIEPENVTALVARSKCYLQIGDAQSALQDAQASLAKNKDFHKGLYQKAEALYQMGDFEYALVFYHRGHKLRPELEEFRLGIQKAQEAIDNCVGSPSSVKLQNKGDLSFFSKMDEGKGKAKPRGQYRPPQKLAATKAARTTKSKSETSHRTAKALLGELYADKEYLEKLLKDGDLVKGSAGGMSIYDLVTSGINYLDTRTEFWRQQKPMYARKRDRMLMQQKWSLKKSDKLSDPTAFILKNLEEIDNYLAEGKGAQSLSLAISTLRAVNKLTDKEVPNKPDVVANLHSCIGNAHLELGQTDEALDHHQKDLAISEKHDFQDARSRALDNLGRVHARVGNFQKAIDCWEEKIPLSKSALESTWLFHEIGRCHLELGASAKAREYGQKSLAEAKRAEDDVWQLNAGVLIAQAEVKLEKFDEALASFEQALETAKLQGDDAAEVAITKALADVREKLQSSIKETAEEPAAQEEPPVEASEDVGENIEQTTVEEE